MASKINSTAILICIFVLHHAAWVDGRTKVKKEQLVKRVDRCIEGTTWEEDCNTCKCSYGVSTCTMMECEKTGSSCKEGSTWEEDCNTCTCSGGFASCTIMACEKTGSSCTEGQTWKNDCNSCWCSDGVPACTIMACEKSASTGLSCTEGQTWQNDCNSCWCSNGVRTCTIMACEKSGSSCKDGSTWENGCNSCWCSGGIPACNIMACEESASLDKGCKEGSTWEKDCNSCWCSGGVPACSMMACENDGKRLDRCQEGTTWVNDCNTCTCNGGVPTCSMMACENDGKRLDRCQEGTTWEDDCNTCTCSGGVRTCTMMACGKSDLSCPVEGSTWNVDCNTCTCTNGHASCTYMQCLEGDSCNVEDSTWNVDCNTCTCNGGLVSCTMMACENLVCNKPCTREYNLVCGSNGQIYKNPCLFEIAQCYDNELVKGECGGLGCNDEGLAWNVDCNTCTCSGGIVGCTKMACEKSLCPAIGCPLCSPDEKEAYGTEIGCPVCYCSSIGKVSEPICNKPCTKEYNPVCGSNGQIYKNPCLFEIAQCYDNEEKLSKGECGGLSCDVEGFTWNVDCNTCMCSGGIAGCTKMACETSEKATDVSCGGNFGTAPGVITHPSTGQYYESNQICTWIVSSSAPLVFHFSKFNTETLHDHVSVRNGGTIGSPLIKEFNGKVLRSNSKFTTVGDGYIQFQSDATVVGSGFHLHWRTLSAEDQCKLKNGFCVQTGDRCNGIFEMIQNSCDDRCDCCVPESDFNDPCPRPDCVCTAGLTPVLVEHEDKCPTCGCVPSPQCFPALCGCGPGFDTVDTVQPDGCPGCKCVPEPCPQPLCVCIGGLTPVLVDHEDKCPTCGCGCADGVLIAGQCLKFHTERMPWEDAKQKCSSQGAKLASLNDPVAFQDYARINHGNGQFWLGASDSANEGEFVWLNGQALEASFPWSSSIGGKPDGGRQQGCLMFGYEGAYDDLKCTHNIGYVCEH